VANAGAVEAGALFASEEGAGAEPLFNPNTKAPGAEAAALLASAADGAVERTLGASAPLGAAPAKELPEEKSPVVVFCEGGAELPGKPLGRSPGRKDEAVGPLLFPSPTSPRCFFVLLSSPSNPVAEEEGKDVPLAGAGAAEVDPNENFCPAESGGGVVVAVLEAPVLGRKEAAGGAEVLESFLSGGGAVKENPPPGAVKDESSGFPVEEADGVVSSLSAPGAGAGFAAKVDPLGSGAGAGVLDPNEKRGAPSEAFVEFRPNPPVNPEPVSVVDFELAAADSFENPTAKGLSPEDCSAADDDEGALDENHALVPDTAGPGKVKPPPPLLAFPAVPAVPPGGGAAPPNENPTLGAAAVVPPGGGKLNPVIALPVVVVPPLAAGAEGAPPKVKPRAPILPAAGAGGALTELPFDAAAASSVAPRVFSHAAHLVRDSSLKDRHASHCHFLSRSANRSPQPVMGPVAARLSIFWFHSSKSSSSTFFLFGFFSSSSSSSCSVMVERAALYSSVVLPSRAFPIVKPCGKSGSGPKSSPSGARSGGNEKGPKANIAGGVGGGALSRPSKEGGRWVEISMSISSSLPSSTPSRL